MFDKLAKLKDMGYYPDTILDIGAYRGYWTDSMKVIFPDSTYYLFEGIDYPELQNHKNAYVAILNDKIEEVNWYQMKNTGDSMFREKTHHFKDCKVIKRETIDLNTLIQQKGILHEAKNIMIKIDCQGAEIPILKGATSILEKTNFIILELPLFGEYNEGVPDFAEHIAFMKSIGFLAYDIIGNHHLNGFTFQLDILFIHKDHNFNKRVAQAIF